MKTTTILLMLPVLFLLSPAKGQSDTSKAMSGFPPSRESQVTFQNYREYPFSKWSFRNAGAPFHVLILPRGGSVHSFASAADKAIPDMKIGGTTLEAIFRDNYTSGVMIVKNNNIIYESYWNGLSRDYQHMWFSMTKSLVGLAFGIWRGRKKIDLGQSPAVYIPELKNTPYARTTIQDVLNMSTALDFKETYTDTSSFYWKVYGTARDAYYVRGARDADPKTTAILGTYDFLATSLKANPNLKPSEVFEYSSANADVIGWLIARVSGQSLTEFIRENIWAKMGAEHDAMMAVDRAYMGVATSAMNTTLNDAALFGYLVLNEGVIDGKRIVPKHWINAMLAITDADRGR